MSAEAVYVGIDVSKDKLAIGVVPGGEVWECAYDDAGIDTLVGSLRERQPALIVLEATGRLEQPIAAALGSAGLAVAIVNPRQVRQYAKATGHLAKTDAIDARVLASFAQTFQPVARALPDEQMRALTALVVRRRQVVKMQTAEKNRLGRAPRETMGRIRSHIAWLEQEVKDLDRELAQMIKRSPMWRARDQLLQSVPGIGPTLSAVLLTQLPELGQLGRKELGALAGLAPLNRDSGAMRGRRTIWGGRAEARTALYMGAWVGVRYNARLRDFYARLRAAGKTRKSALTACAHKLLTMLNAMMRDQAMWRGDLLAA
jgi:transposase